MKNLLAVMVMVVVMTGCTGINTGVMVNVATDAAFVLVLQNNPSYKPVVIAALTEVKSMLANSMTYDELVLAIAAKLPGKYAVVAVALSAYISSDKPYFETYLPMLDSYKQAVATKIDRFLFLASL